MSDSAPREFLIHLMESLNRHFNKGELKTLCFELGVDYDDLPGEGKAEKARELVAYVDRHGMLERFIVRCQELRPTVDWKLSSKKIFIAYKRNSEPDSQIATQLLRVLTDDGHNVFIDKSLRTGTQWLIEIDRQIKASDFLIVLLSPESADSEMVQSEVTRAYEYRKLQGHPQTLPIRIKFDGLLPYSIDAFLNKYQYIEWEGAEDNERLKHDILAAINGQLSNRQPYQLPSVSKDIYVSEDGRIAPESTMFHPPLPEFDPRVLSELSVPGGTVTLRDQLYVRREVDVLLENQIARDRNIITIRGSRQSGKSSLLLRGIQQGKNNDRAVVNLDLQRVNRDYLENVDDFLRYLATFILRKLRLDTRKVDDAWQDALGPQDKISQIMEDYVLVESESSIILAMDEVDRLLETPFHADFFGLLRSWYNSGAYEPIWEKLNIVMAISTEPYLLITDANQSPFNVGLKLYLEDFTSEQTQFLNQRHGAPVSAQNFAQFMLLLNGHPYLTRKALYTLVTEQLTWTEFVDLSDSDRGPFSDHLRRQLWLLRDEPDLQNALKQVVRKGDSEDEEACYRLDRAGLIKKIADGYVCRCELYQKYFEDKFGL